MPASQLHRSIARIVIIILLMAKDVKTGTSGFASTPMDSLGQTSADLAPVAIGDDPGDVHRSAVCTCDGERRLEN